MAPCTNVTASQRTLDQPASSQALWAIYASTGVRPEFLIPVLAFESGLNPASANSCGYSGLNGIASAFLIARGIAETDYLTWAASRQLTQVVAPFLAGVISVYGPLTSGVRVYQGNFYPASLKYAPGLDDTIVASPAAAYAANAIFDTGKTGRITPRDLGNAIASQLAHGAVQEALADAYANAPAGVGPMQDPVFGEDTTPTTAAAASSGTSVAGFVTGAAIASVIAYGISALFDAWRAPARRTA
jgi:hypothetical protein